MKKQPKEKIEFNGYSFNDSKIRKEMRYLIVGHGDLDLNNAVAFQNLRGIKEYIKYKKEVSNFGEVWAIFAIKDLTKKLLK